MNKPSHTYEKPLLTLQWGQLCYREEWKYVQGDTVKRSFVWYRYTYDKQGIQSVKKTYTLYI